jgi:protein ImuB
VGDPELTHLLARLGVHTLGAFAALEPDRVRERFGERGVRLHDLAAGADSRPVQPRTPPPELHREVAFEPALEDASQVAFGMRIAAEEFLDRLGSHGLVCTELRVGILAERGERSDRVWLHPGSFDAAAVVDRVRWQLAEASDLRSGVVLVRLEPAAVDAASHHQPAIFGSGADEKVHHALSRVQAMLGHRGVLTPVIEGGRWLGERQTLVPWGDRVEQRPDATRPWPGSLPPPLPTTVFPRALPVDVVTGQGAVVVVDDRGALSGEPELFAQSGPRREIVSWAGPWPVDERGWDADRRRVAHRFQVVDADLTAWLLICEDGAWSAEARYD